MNDRDLKLWKNITFKTQGYRKNIGFVNINECIITEYNGTISEIRLNDNKPPLIIGEYGLSVWNIGVGRELDIDINELLISYAVEDTYIELVDVIKNKKIDINNYKKIVLIHTFVLHEEYRKSGITEEFIEMIYWDFYSEDVGIIALVKPFQNIKIDADYYLNKKIVPIRDNIDPNNTIYLTAKEYYSLNSLQNKSDIELNEYKLFDVASRCGFTRISESHLFILTPELVIERIKIKNKFINMIKI